MGAAVTCQSCAARDAIIQRQQAEIIRLQRVIQSAQAVSARIEAEADKVLNGSGVPRGKWAFAKGAKDAAEAIYRRLAG